MPNKMPATKACPRNSLRRRTSATITNPITVANQPKAWKKPSETKPASNVARS